MKIELRHLFGTGFVTKAMVIKSEALYNMCHFEHALVLFHRGQVL